MHIELTEKEVKTTLDIRGFPGKWKKAIEFARSKNDQRTFWTNTREYFLALGGQFKWQ